MSTWRDRWQHALMDNYGTPPLTLVRGSGARVWDDEGREYIDLIAGIAVNALGHAHPALVEAVSSQMSTLGHTSNLYVHPTTVELAERLITISGGDDSTRVFFCNSGAEANEAAFKLSRLTGRTKVVVAQTGFHGRTMGSLALTAQPAKQDPFRPLPGDVVVVPYGDADALTAAVTADVAAVFLEPIQGEGGVIVPPSGYLAAARAACDAVNALLVLDEVQTGIGRTGTWFAHQPEGVRPDVMTLAKGLGGGMPIGAVVAHGRAASLFTPGSHGSTFGGNPIVTRAALTVLDVIEQDGLLERVVTIGERLQQELPGHSAGHVDHLRGRGLLLAAVLREPIAAQVEPHLRASGLLANVVGPNAIRLAPPLILADVDVADVLSRWQQAFTALERSST